MKRHSSTIFLSASLVFGLLISGCKEGPQSENVLVGKWLLQRKGVAASLPHKLHWEFTEDEIIVWIVRENGESEEASRNSYVVDNTRVPNWITVILSGDNPEARPGIYQVFGDELHILQTIDNGARPEKFGGDDYSVLRRIGENDH